MDFTPEDMEAVQTCLEGIDGNVPVTVEPAAAVLLMPDTVRTVADILNLPTWPVAQLRPVVERWQPAAEVRIERTGASGQVRSPSASKAVTIAPEFFWGRRKARRPRHRIRLCPDASGHLCALPARNFGATKNGQRRTKA